MATADSTKLELVNSMLSAVGHARTSDIDSSAPTVILAVQILDQVDREVQARGWYWNSEYEVEIQKNGSDQYELPLSVFRIEESPLTARRTSNFGLGTDHFYIKLGSLVYDTISRTSTFADGPDSISLDWIVRRDFEDIPESARQYIGARAARQLFRRLRGAESSDLSELEARTLQNLMAEESDVANLNQYTGNPSTFQAFRGRHKYLPRD